MAELIKQTDGPVFIGDDVLEAVQGSGTAETDFVEVSGGSEDECVSASATGHQRVLPIKILKRIDGRRPWVDPVVLTVRVDLLSR